MPENHSNTNRVITILIHSDKKLTLLRRVAKGVTPSLLSWHKRYDLMPQIFDVTANENARYKRNELEYPFCAKKALVIAITPSFYIIYPRCIRAKTFRLFPTRRQLLCWCIVWFVHVRHDC